MLFPFPIIFRTIVFGHIVLVTIILITKLSVASDTFTGIVIILYGINLPGCVFLCFMTHIHVDDDYHQDCYDKHATHNDITPFKKAVKIFKDISGRNPT